MSNTKKNHVYLILMLIPILIFSYFNSDNVEIVEADSEQTVYAHISYAGYDSYSEYMGMNRTDTRQDKGKKGVLVL